MASNYTISGLESRGNDLPAGQVDKNLSVDESLVPPNAPDDEDPGVEIYINNDTFSYAECHKVLADGRIVEIDPVTGKWSRRPAGMAKELWNRLPHLRKQLQLLGPALFTDEDLRDIGVSPVLSGPSAIGPSSSGGTTDLTRLTPMTRDLLSTTTFHPPPRFPCQRLSRLICDHYGQMRSPITISTPRALP